MIIYKNTIENATRIGWIHLPEFCEGDENSPLVLHDTKLGKFFFVSAC